MARTQYNAPHERDRIRASVNQILKIDALNWKTDRITMFSKIGFLKLYFQNQISKIRFPKPLPRDAPDIELCPFLRVAIWIAAQLHTWYNAAAATTVSVTSYSSSSAMLRGYNNPLRWLAQLALAAGSRLQQWNIEGMMPSFHRQWHTSTWSSALTRAGRGGQGPY